MPDDAFIRQKQLLLSGLTPFSASTLWRKVKCGQFPAPIKISEQITAFRLGDIRQWLEDPAGYIGNQTDSSAAKNARKVAK